MTATPEQALSVTECVLLVAACRAAVPGGPRALPAELLAHRDAILEIAAGFQRPPEEVARLYCDELARLAGRAAVADYLPVLAAKRIRSQYKLQASAKSAIVPDGHE